MERHRSALDSAGARSSVDLQDCRVTVIVTVSVVVLDLELAGLGSVIPMKSAMLGHLPLLWLATLEQQASEPDRLPLLLLATLEKQASEPDRSPLLSRETFEQQRVRLDHHAPCHLEQQALKPEH